MAGGCCCCVKSQDSAIVGFAVMNITLFAILLLVCSHIYDTQCYGYYHSDIFHYNRCKASTQHLLLILAILFCLVGIIAGILLLFAVSTKKKSLFVTWIILECICLFVNFIMVCGLFLLGGLYAFYTYPLLLFVCTFPFFIWSAVAVCMSMNGIVSGTVGNEQQGQIYGQGYSQQFQPPSNQQMLPPNQNGGYPSQTQYGNNPAWPQLYQMPPPPSGGPPPSIH